MNRPAGVSGNDGPPVGGHGTGAKGGVPEIGPPVALFQTRLWGGGTNSTNNQQYDVAPDNRFLMNVTTEDAIAQPITLLLNWRSLK